MPHEVPSPGNSYLGHSQSSYQSSRQLDGVAFRWHGVAPLSEFYRYWSMCSIVEVVYVVNSLNPSRE